MFLEYIQRAAAHAGQTDSDNDVNFNDFRLAVSTEYAGLGLEFGYTNTSFSADECINFAGSSDLCDERFIFTVSKEM